MFPILSQFKILSFWLVTMLVLGNNCPLKAQNFYHIDTIQKIEIDFYSPRWESILDSLKNRGNNQRILAKVSVNGYELDSVGVRYKGNSSYYNVKKGGSPKLPFNIKSNEFIKGQTFPENIKTIKLSNVFRDPSFLREVLSYQIANQYMPSPMANFTEVYVNGKWMGFYNNTSDVDKRFFKKHFNYKKGVLVKCDPKWKYQAKSKNTKCLPGEKSSLVYQGKDTTCYEPFYELKTKTGWKEIQRLTEILNKQPDSLEKVLNIDAVLWMHAFNNILVNLDSYIGRLCHNYYLYQDKNGIFQPIVWDMNLSFGGFRYTDTSKPLTNVELQELSPFVHYRNDKRPLISKVLSTPLYRKIYIAHLKTILEENFSNGKYLSNARKIQNQIDSYVQKDSNKLYPYQTFRQNLNSTSDAKSSKIIGIQELMIPRIQYLQSHPLLKKQEPIIRHKGHTVRDSTVTIDAEFENIQNAYICIKEDKKGIFKRISLRSRDNDNLNNKPSHTYSVEVQYIPGMKYYFIGEAEKTAATLPKRSLVEHFTIE